MPSPAPNPTAEFDEFAEDYDAALAEGISVSGEDKNYFARGRIEHLRRVLKRLGESPSQVMDFGCGTGSATPFFLEWPTLQRLVGTEVSARSLDVAIASHASARAQFFLMSDYLPDAKLDLVFCNGVFHHIPPHERAEAMQYIYHCLRPGGYFALFENNPWNPGTRYVMSRIPFDRDAVTLSPPTGRKMLKLAGFEIIRTDFCSTSRACSSGCGRWSRWGGRSRWGASIWCLGARAERTHRLGFFDMRTISAYIPGVLP